MYRLLQNAFEARTMHLHTRILSLITATLMALELLTSLNVTVSAASAAKKYSGSGYTVTYSIDGKKSSVTLDNTGRKPIINWALEVDGIDGVKNCTVLQYTALKRIRL